MSEVLMVPDYNRNNGNNSNLDSALLLSMMNNGGFGNGSWMWIIFLFFLEPLMRNGFFGNGFGNNGGFNGNCGGLGYLANRVDDNAGRELLMQAINGNADAIQNLANRFNTTNDFIQQAICGVQNSISQLGGQVGLSGQQTINAIQQGNMTLASQLASCCCDLRTAITTGNYENQIATLQQTQLLSGETRNVKDVVTQGFCDTAYAFRDQTCTLGGKIQESTQVIKDATNAQTQAILAKLDNMERTGLLDKIDAQRETINTLRTNSNIKDQNYLTQQSIAAAVAPINAALAEIRCAQPNTVTVPFYPFKLQANCGCDNNNGNCTNQFWY